LSAHDDKRPDRLLSLIQRADSAHGKGHLKVFLGMVAGVGKTFAMLQRAHQLKSQGVDVVVGWVDTHGRAETAKLLEGLEVLPRREINHRGVTVTELDLDALLKRRPKIALVDELAHSNAPGSRHEKRYMDVKELLQAGIDVFTAVNVQHIESRVDTVREITGVAVQETVPDSILDSADEVVLIDLPPDDLLLRLKEGRIYPAERADLAADHFFQRGNLTALRELALRTASDRVDRDLRDFKTLHGIDKAWKSSSRLMVGVFGSPYSDSLIRWTRQLSETMRGTWIGVYVDTGRPQSPEEQALLEKNTALVRRIGGEFVSTQDQNLVEGLLRVARENNVTQIIVGKTQRPHWTTAFRGGSVVQKLLRQSGDIDVYAVAASRDTNGPLELPRTPHRGIPPEEIGWMFATVMAAWLGASGVAEWVGYESIGILFLMVVTVSGLAFSRASIFVLAACLGLIHNFFFIPPLYDFNISKPQDALMVLMFFLAATSIGHLTSRLRRQNALIQKRERLSIQLYKLSQRIGEACDVSEVVQAGVEMLSQDFDAAVAVLLRDSEDSLQLSPHSSFVVESNEMGVAEWTKQNKSQAGRFTDTLLSSVGTYFPLTSKKTVLGVVGLRFSPTTTALNFETRSQIQNLIEQLGSAIEREQLHDSQRKLSNLEQADRLHRSLFDSVSHELKTPLTTIKGASSALNDAHAEITPAYVRDLATQIGDEAERLLSLVNNMLDMTRLESGGLKANKSAADVADILGPTLARVSGERGNRVISTHIPLTVRPLFCDSALLVQALTNIVSNAICYTPKNGHISIQVIDTDSHWVEILVDDDGPGLPKPNPEVVFNRFYRQNPQHSGGVGLGLSIAKGFVEAQGGQIQAENNARGGARFRIRVAAMEGRRAI
jgi:two-component system sensor histidine kinase KdpD